MQKTSGIQKVPVQAGAPHTTQGANPSRAHGAFCKRTPPLTPTKMLWEAVAFSWHYWEQALTRSKQASVQVIALLEEQGTGMLLQITARGTGDAFKQSAQEAFSQFSFNIIQSLCAACWPDSAPALYNGEEKRWGMHSTKPASHCSGFSSTSSFSPTRTSMGSMMFPHHTTTQTHALGWNTTRNLCFTAKLSPLLTTQSSLPAQPGYLCRDPVTRAFNHVVSSHPDV